MRRRFDVGWAGRLDFEALGGGGGRVVPACAGMTEEGGAAITKARRWCKVTPVKQIADLLDAAQRARRVAAALTRSGGGGG